MSDQTDVEFFIFGCMYEKKTIIQKVSTKPPIFAVFPLRDLQTLLPRVSGEEQGDTSAVARSPATEACAAERCVVLCPLVRTNLSRPRSPFTPFHTRSEIGNRRTTSGGIRGGGGDGGDSSRTVSSRRRGSRSARSVSILHRNWRHLVPGTTSCALTQMGP